MKKFLIALFILAPSALFAQTAAPPPGATTTISLQDALAIAEQSSAQMRTARNALRNSRMGVTRAYAAFLPSISTSAGFTPAQNGADAQFNTGISAGLSGIFNQNTYFAVGTAKRSLESQQASFVATQFNLRSTVKQQYFAVLQAQEQLTAANNTLNVANENMNYMRGRVGTGLVVASDSLSQMVQVLNAELAVITAKNNIANQIRTFSRTLGLDYQVQPDIRDTANFQVIQLDSAALMSMVRESPQAIQQRTAVATQRHSLRTAKLAYLPTVSGSLNWSRNGSGQGMFGFGEKQYRYSGGEPRIGFNLSLPVFNAFGRESQLISAREGVDNAELNFRDQMLNLESQLINLINSIRTTQEQMRIQQLQLGIQEHNMRVVETRFGLALDNGLALLNAQNSLFNARNSIINTRNTYRNQIAQLEALIGRELR